VIDAAATKPFGFMRFYPGPGLGGHCIPVDPLYLQWKMKTLKYETRFIALADEINTGMPHLVVEKTTDALNQQKKAVNGSKILIIGMAYKKDIDDVRESPSLDIVELFMQKGAEVSYHDPYAAQVQIGTHLLKSVACDKLGLYDAVVIVTDHSNIDYKQVARESKCVVDTRNALKGLRGEVKGTLVSI
jgi:UDP-N-acetyl-D-glucosamine dehydrogenase